MPTKTETLTERIAEHGRKLLAIFPDCLERDPVKLCKRLRRIEAKGNAHAVRRCNGPEWPSEEAEERERDRILDEAHTLLGVAEGDGGPNVFLNGDPRGYALKISSEYVKVFSLDIPTDWGGYGLIAPDLRDGR